MAVHVMVKHSTLWVVPATIIFTQTTVSVQPYERPTWPQTRWREIEMAGCKETNMYGIRIDFRGRRDGDNMSEQSEFWKFGNLGS